MRLIINCSSCVELRHLTYQNSDWMLRIHVLHCDFAKCFSINKTSPRSASRDAVFFVLCVLSLIHLLMQHL